MEEAERIAKDEHGSVKIAVISGKLALSAMNHNTYLSLEKTLNCVGNSTI